MYEGHWGVHHRAWDVSRPWSVTWCGGPPPLWTSCPILSFIRVDVNQLLTSITRTSSPRLSLSVASSRECQTILPTELEHFNRKFSLEAENRKIRIILQISSDPGVEVFLVQEPGMDFIGDIREAPSTTTRWILTSSIRMHPVKWIVNTHILQVSSLIWSWNVDAGIFLHMLTIVSPVIEVMCSEHFLRTGSGGHSMWSSPWNSVEDECRSRGKSPDVWILTVSWHLKIENREKNQCFDQFSCTWHYCHESSMASGFQGQSLYFAHILNSQVSRRLLRVSSSLLPFDIGPR